MHKRLRKIFEELNIPHYRIIRKVGKKQESAFIVYDVIFSNDIPYADDAMATEISIRLNLYTRSDYTEIWNKLKHKLIENNFYSIEMLGEEYEEDTQYYHIPIEFKYLEE